MKKIIIILLISFPYKMHAQNVGIGTTVPVTKLDIAAGGSNPAIPGTTSTAHFRIGIGTAEGIDFGKMGSPPYSAWMQAGLNGVISDPLSLQPLGGNVGIGTISPAERLDVTGNINVTGTIKANGVDGIANQVLMKNSSGILAWGNMCEYKNFVSYSIPGTYSWTVPSGVTKILVEGWGGGGGASLSGGGGGGGYIKGILNVVPGNTVTIIVGAGGAGGLGGAAGSPGNFSRASYPGGFSYTAEGGLEASLTAPGAGGQYNTGISPLHIGLQGSPGGQNTERFEQYNTSSFLRAITYGNGGNAGNTYGTGGSGGFISRDASTSALIRSFQGSHGSIPGGGGGGGSNAYTGANGMVVIYY